MKSVAVPEEHLDRVNDPEGGRRQLLQALAQQSVLGYDGEGTNGSRLALHSLRGRRPAPSVDVPVPAHISRSPRFIHGGIAALGTPESIPEPSGDSAGQELLLEAAIRFAEEYLDPSPIAGRPDNFQ